MNINDLASWLLTYLVHSTVLLGAAWLASRALGDRRLALQEILLRTALVGGLLTSGLQLILGMQPLAGALSVGQFAANPNHAVGAAAVTAVEIGQSVSEIVPLPESTTTLSGTMAGAMLALWAAGSLLALISLGRSIQDLRRLLKTRRAHPAGRILERLANAMGLRQPVRLSTSKAIAVPFATGIRKPEICCPERVCDLAIEHQTGLFAHELAHLARRDPAWQLLYRLGEAVFVLQPLNRLIRRRLEEIAEHLTDERAVACTGNRLGLARCLVVVAHWGSSSQIGIPATAFASGPRLDQRVRRLLAGGTGEDPAPGWATPLAIALLIAAAVTLPFVAAGPVDAEAFSDVPTEVVTKTWSDAQDVPQSPPPPAPPEAAARTDEPEPPPRAPMVDPEPETVPEPRMAPEVNAEPEVLMVPEPVVAPEPVTVPEPDTVLEAPTTPESATAPESDVSPTPATHPAPATPPSQASPRTEHPSPEEREARRTYESERRSYERKAREMDEARVRAEAKERSSAERSQAMATREAERAQALQSRRQEQAERSAERAAIAEARAQPRTRESQERAQELANRARSDEHRTELRQLREAEAALRSEQRRIAAEARAREHAAENLERAQRRAEERARMLEDQARRLAEQSEAERQAAEEQQRLEAEKEKK